MISVLIITALLWSSLGVTQGILWSKTGNDAFKWNEHLVFATTMFLILLLVQRASVLPSYFVWPTLCIMASWYPFFYNGSYYLTRKLIDKTGRTYPKGWISEPSKDSTACINLSWVQRLIMFLAGLLALLVIIHYLVWFDQPQDGSSTPYINRVSLPSQNKGIQSHDMLAHQT